MLGALGVINILLLLYDITNSKRYSVFWSSTDTQITPYNWHFCYIKLNINRVKLVHKVLITTLMITWLVKIDVILLFTCSIVIEHKFSASQLQLCPPLN